MQMELHCPFDGKSLWFQFMQFVYCINFHPHNMMRSSPNCPKGMSELLIILVYNSLFHISRFQDS